MAAYTYITTKALEWFIILSPSQRNLPTKHCWVQNEKLADKNIQLNKFLPLMKFNRSFFQQFCMFFSSEHSWTIFHVFFLELWIHQNGYWIQLILMHSWQFLINAHLLQGYIHDLWQHFFFLQFIQKPFKSRFISMNVSRVMLCYSYKWRPKYRRPRKKGCEHFEIARNSQQKEILLIQKND